MTIQYTVKRFNPVCNAYTPYHTTCDISDAYNVANSLISKGDKAIIQQGAKHE
jgi:hypothetical protein